MQVPQAATKRPEPEPPRVSAEERLDRAVAAAQTGFRTLTGNPGEDTLLVTALDRLLGRCRIFRESPPDAMDGRFRSLVKFGANAAVLGGAVYFLASIVLAIRAEEIKFLLIGLFGLQATVVLHYIA